MRWAALFLLCAAPMSAERGWGVVDGRESDGSHLLLYLEVSDEGVELRETYKTTAHALHPTAMHPTVEMRGRSAQIMESLEPHHAPSHAGLIEGGIWVAYESSHQAPGNGSVAIHHLTVLDPRQRWYDWGGHIGAGGTLHFHQSAIITVVVPDDVAAVRVAAVAGGLHRATQRYGATTRRIPAAVAHHPAEVAMRKAVVADRSAKVASVGGGGGRVRARGASATQSVSAADYDFSRCEALGAQCSLMRRDDSGLLPLVNCTWQRSGHMAKQPLLIMMSCGYQVAHLPTFCDHVAEAFYGRAVDPDCPTRARHGLKVTAPWRTLAPLFNVFSVFEASADSGASKPKSGIQKDTNLECTYGRDVERALASSYTKSVALASVIGAGATDPRHRQPFDALKIVLVHDTVHGGTGGGGFGSVAAGQTTPLGTYAETFIHELGHAHANLTDEYAYGVAEARNLSLTNCALAAESTDSLPWSHWINKSASDADVALQKKPLVSTPLHLLMASNPPSPCGYSNYMRPTHTTPNLYGNAACSSTFVGAVEGAAASQESAYLGRACLMESSKAEMCPVCREATLRAILKKRPYSGLQVEPDVLAPRLPVLEETVHIARGLPDTDTRGHIDLFISKALFDDDRVDDTLTLTAKWTLVNQDGTIAELPAASLLPPVASAQPTTTSGNSDDPCRGGGARYSAQDCDKPTGWTRRGTDEARRLWAQLVTCGTYPCEVRVRAAISDQSQPRPWATLDTPSGPSLFAKTAEFRVVVHADVASLESAPCKIVNRTAEVSNTRLNYDPPRAEIFPSYDFDTTSTRPECTQAGASAARCFKPKDLSYCAVCDEGSDCGFTLQFSEYVPRSAPRTDTLAGWVTAMGIIVVVMLVLVVLSVIGLFFLIAHCCDRRAAVGRLGMVGELVGGAMQVVFIIVIVLAFVVTVAAFYLYTQSASGLYGPNFATFVLVCSIVAGSVAVLGIAVVHAQHRWLMLAVAIVTTLAALGGLVVAVIIISTIQDADLDHVEKSRQALRSRWVDMVEKYPVTACGFQNDFKCSGFLQACHNVASEPCGPDEGCLFKPTSAECSSHSDCTDPAVGSNRNAEPCFEAVRRRMQEQSLWAILGSSVFAVFLVIASALAWTLFFKFAPSVRVEAVLFGMLLGVYMRFLTYLVSFHDGGGVCGGGCVLVVAFVVVVAFRTRGLCRSR